MPDWQPRKPSILILANGDAIDACLITSARVVRRVISACLDEPNGYTVLIGCGSNTFDVDFRDVDEANAERDRVIEAWRAATDEAKLALDDAGASDLRRLLANYDLANVTVDRAARDDASKCAAATVALERWDTWAVNLLGKEDSQGLWRQVLRTEIELKCTTVEADGHLHSHVSIVHELADLAKDRDIARKRCCLLASESTENPEFDEVHFAAQYGWSYLYPAD